MYKRDVVENNNQNGEPGHLKLEVRRIRPSLKHWKEFFYAHQNFNLISGRPPQTHYSNLQLSQSMLFDSLSGTVSQTKTMRVSLNENWRDDGDERHWVWPETLPALIMFTSNKES